MPRTAASPRCSGGGVSNWAVISAKLGKVGLGSGEMATLDLAGDGFLSVAVPTAQLGSPRDGNGRALVSNKGRINAQGGTVYLSPRPRRASCATP